MADDWLPGETPSQRNARKRRELLEKLKAFAKENGGTLITIAGGLAILSLSKAVRKGKGKGRRR